MNTTSPTLRHPWQTAYEARTRLTGHGPTPHGMIPCQTIGGDCCPTWGPFSTGRADHFHPVGPAWCWAELARLARENPRQLRRELAGRISPTYTARAHWRQEMDELTADLDAGRITARTFEIEAARIRRNVAAEN